LRGMAGGETHHSWLGSTWLIRTHVAI